MIAIYACVYLVRASNILPFRILILVTQYAVIYWGMYFLIPIMIRPDDFCRRFTLSRDSEFGKVSFRTSFCKVLRGRGLAHTNIYLFHRARGLPRPELPRTAILASVRVSVIISLPILTRCFSSKNIYISLFLVLLAMIGVHNFCLPGL
jgi:hypothetical protein